MSAQPGGRHRAGMQGAALLEPPGGPSAPPSGRASRRIVVHARGPLAAAADEVDEYGHGGSPEGFAVDDSDAFSLGRHSAGDVLPPAGPEYETWSAGRAIGAQRGSRIPGRRSPVPDTQSLLIAPPVPGPGMRPHAERAAWYLSAAGIAGWDEMTPVRRRTSEDAHPAAAMEEEAAEAEEQVPAAPSRARTARTTRWLEDLTPGGLDQLLGEPATRALGGRMPRDLPEGSAALPGVAVRRGTVPRPDSVAPTGAAPTERVPSVGRPVLAERTVAAGRAAA
ncbi:MAG TPA: hypothetical protein VFP72_22395, partial [Kineosporiaceae bacterium]|nr:hypothetical protein [Kineosporiaceae bacterium]